MTKTTLPVTLIFVMALLLLAQVKPTTLSTEEKLQLSRLEAAAVKAQATLTNFLLQAQRAVQEMEQKAKESREAHEKLIADLKKKYALDAACTFDENQEPKCPVEEAKK